MNKINAQNIYKSFQGLEVLKGINLSVDEGEVVAVIGPSGGGKSTFLRCLNKLEIIDSGKIVIDGETLAETKPDGQVVYAPGDESRRIACKMGMVFQQFNLFPHMTVLENLIEAPVQVQKRNRDDFWFGFCCECSNAELFHIKLFDTGLLCSKKRGLSTLFG